MAAKKMLLCSDMDGTLSFEAKQLEEWGKFVDNCSDSDGGASDQSTVQFQYDEKYAPGIADSGGSTIDLVPLPPSSSGKIAFVSQRLQSVVQEIRSKGVYFVIITGARASTTISRLTGLPTPDAVVCESGGRMFVADHQRMTNPESDSVSLLTEDWGWRKELAPPSVVGSYSASSRAVPPENRSGELWNVYRQVKLLLEQDELLKESKIKLDTNGYETCFRVLHGGPFAERILGKVQLPETLMMQINLKHLDIMPATSSKGNAVNALAKRLGITDRQCLFAAGDDDNDAGMFSAVGAACAPANATPALRLLKDSLPPEQALDRIFVSQRFGPAGTEEGLRRLILRMQSIQEND